MKLISTSLFFCLVYFSFILEVQSATTSSAPELSIPIREQQMVRVRLLSTVKKIDISGLGLKFQNLSQPFRPVAIPDSGRAEVRVMERNGKKLWVLRVNGKDPEHLFPEKFLMVQGSQLRVGTKALPERILLRNNGVKNVDVVGVVPLDDYIVGVLASEMPLSWPLETLKAQVVAARSYALAVMEERKNQDFHLESSILDQVFHHVKDSSSESPMIRKAIQAVTETKDIKLYDNQQKILKAFFHSDCGGRTTTAKNVWNSDVNSGVAVDNSCPTNPKARWKLTLNKDELSRRLKVPEVVGLRLIKTHQENRIKAVRLAFNENQSKVLSVNNFRQMLGFEELRSSFFVLKKVGESFIFEGQGFGHGVGLCQWGSRALGKSGQSFKQILKHYYPLARLK